MTQPAQIACLRIPVTDATLLLPNTAVAEVADYQKPEAIPGAPEWFLGYIRWRGTRIPVISWEGANQRNMGDGDTRIAILNTIGPNHERIPFIGFVTQGLPRLARISEADLKPAEDNPVGPADKALVLFEDQVLHIPDIEYLERITADVMAMH